MTVQVQPLPINNEFVIKSSVSVSPTQGGRHPISVSTRSRVGSSPHENTSPNVQTFGMGLPSPPPERDDLPVIHSQPVDALLRSNIIEAASAAAMNQPDAEAAFFVADLGYIYRQYQRWKRALPNVTPFYAVKANPDPVVLRLLSALGTGFDCASMNEINMVAELEDVNPTTRVIFANPCKPTSFVKHAAKMGVDMTTFDNMDELYKIARVHPGAKLVIRILTDDSKALCRLGLKFGAPLVAVPTLLAKAKELGLNVIGVSFHVGSGCYDTGAFADAVYRAKKVFEMGREAGYSFRFLDVGGGFEDERFEEAASVLSKALEEHFFGWDSSIEVIAEPGRYFVANAFTLATNIIARRGPDRVALVEEEETAAAAAGEGAGADDVENPKVMYYLNDGIYSSFNCILFDHQTVTPFCLTVGKALVGETECQAQMGEMGKLGLQELQEHELVTSSLWGPTCDSIDCVATSVKLPRRLQVGDWLGFRKMGAYTICAASSFNGFDRTRVVYTVGEEFCIQSLVV